MSHEIRTPDERRDGRSACSIDLARWRASGRTVDMLDDSARALMEIINDARRIQDRSRAARTEALPFSLRDTLDQVATRLPPRPTPVACSFGLHQDRCVPDRAVGDACCARCSTTWSPTPRNHREGSISIAVLPVPCEREGALRLRIECATPASACRKAGARLFQSFSRPMNPMARRWRHRAGAGHRPPAGGADVRRDRLRHRTGLRLQLLGGIELTRDVAGETQERRWSAARPWWRWATPTRATQCWSSSPMPAHVPSWPTTVWRWMRCWPSAPATTG